jgi:pyridoxamine 5'-phosphate oxidase
MLDSEALSKLRRSFTLKVLRKFSVSPNPVEQFAIWMNEALDSAILDPNAMVLSTVSVEGIPSARIVLLRNFDEKGFVFFTNYESAKANDLQSNNNVSLLFFWAELERQIRVTGIAEKISQEESEEYFNSRPREHQMSAWASKQSSVIENRKTLEDKFDEMKKHFEGKHIPLPPFWGGFRVVPQKFEFWKGRESRLHDRICYRNETGEWKIQRLSP